MPANGKVGQKKPGRMTGHARILIPALIILALLFLAGETGGSAHASDTGPLPGIETAPAEESENEDIPVFNGSWSEDDEEGEPGSGRENMGEPATQTGTSNLTWRVETAFRNLFNTRRSRTFTEDYEKNELTARIELTWGPDENHLYSLTDASLLPTFINDRIGDEYVYSPDTVIARNLRISSKESEVIFRELYFHHAFQKGRIRVGNQIYAWGTADFINSTAYINPQDLREALFRDENRMKLPVPSVSGMFFLKSATLELVWVPVSMSAPLAPTGNFWAPKLVEDKYPLIFDDPDPMDPDVKNFGYAARVSKSLDSMDISVSAYHGPDTQPVIRPLRTDVSPGRPIGIVVRPEYHMVDFIGADFSLTRGDFVVSGEGAVSPDKTGSLDQDLSDAANIIFPYPLKKSPYFSYSIGFNYFIPMEKFIAGHSGDALFTMEWFQARYTNPDINDPDITDILTTRFQDDYFDGRIHLSLTGIFETRRGGSIIWPEIDYDFKNGFKLECSYASISGSGNGTYESDSLLRYFKDNDFIMVNLKYAYP
ncbi:MAG: hypothetical protein GXP53_08380 [Deltaproteobacteria bacterium]|nr:hypothetical protein [Deltaproteobacteria bacterium]